MSPKDFKIGQRVQAHPGTDRWMRGARFGTVEGRSRYTVYVRFDRIKKLASVQPRNLIIEEE